MYPKREVCFTVIATLAVSWYLGSQQVMTGAEGQGVVVGLRDGTHPPPPPPPLASAELLQADGTHPPPPPPLPPPPLANAETLQADGTHPPPPPWLLSAVQAG